MVCLSFSESWSKYETCVATTSSPLVTGSDPKLLWCRELLPLVELILAFPTNRLPVSWEIVAASLLVMISAKPPFTAVVILFFFSLSAPPLFLP